jgi:hypothetical protein
MTLVLEVTDRDGWRKEFPLERRLVLVGSNPSNQIALAESRGQGVERLHLQLMLDENDPFHCKVLNTSSGALEINEGGEPVMLDPRKSRVVAMNTEIKVGEFRLQLCGAGPGVPLAASNGNGHRESSIHAPNSTPVAGSPFVEPAFVRQRLAAPPVFAPGPVGLAVRLTQATLTRSQPAEAVVTISNRGDKTAVQFRLQVDGLPPESIEVPPLPLLFPGAEKTFGMTLSHPPTVLRAGPHLLRFIAVAPDAYPGEQATVQQTVNVPAIYTHELSIRGPL